MKWIDVEELLRDVRVALDENSGDARLHEQGDTDTLELDELIRSKVEDGARLVEQEAAHWLLGEGEPFDGSIEWENYPGHGGGRLLLPDDFLRLVSFKMTDWSRAVTEAISEDNPKYDLQCSRYGGVRGNPQKPVVAIVSSPVGRLLEFYSCTGGYGTGVERGSYIPVPLVTEGQVLLCDMLYRAVVYRVASLTAHSIGEVAVGEMLEKTSNQLAEIERT